MEGSDRIPAFRERAFPSENFSFFCLFFCTVLQILFQAFAPTIHAETSR